MTFMLSVGRWGGFYWHRAFGIRLCLGWVALTWLPVDIDDWLAGATEELERLRRIEVAIRDCPTTILQHTGIKTLIYTTQLRDALEVK